MEKVITDTVSSHAMDYLAKRLGISHFICTAIQRKGPVYAESVNRTKLDFREVIQTYKGHITDGTLLLCDGLHSYNALSSVADCTLKDCSNPTEEDDYE